MPPAARARAGGASGRTARAVVGPSRFSGSRMKTPGPGRGSMRQTRGVQRDAHTGEDPDARALEAQRILIMPVEQIVDSSERGQPMAQIIGAGKVHRGI